MVNEVEIDFREFFTQVKKVFKTPRSFFNKLSVKKLTEVIVFLSFITLLGIALDLIGGYVVRPWIAQVTKTTPLFVYQGSLAVNFFVLALSGVLLVLASFVWTGLLHIWLKFLKIKLEFRETYASFAYSRTPLSLLGWIPYVGVVAGIYSLYILITGVSVYGNVSFKRALLSVLPLMFLVFLLQLGAYSLLANQSL